MNFRDLPLPNDDGEQYIVAGAVCALRTNSEAIRAAMSGSFARLAEPAPASDVSMRLWVDGTSRDAQPWPKPYFRGLSHLVFAAFDSESELLIDLRRQRITGRLSSEIAANRAYFKRCVFPALFGIVSETIQITPVHCACVAGNTCGVLLAGDSGSGKSTLALALAQSGLSFVSDDWTYVSRRGKRLLAWGLNNSLKLLPDAVGHFPELVRIDPSVSLNGELAYELQPDRMFRIRRCACTEPHSVIFLQRRENQELSLTEMYPDEAAARLEQNLEELPAKVWRAKSFLVKTIRKLVQGPCWELRYGADTPQTTAQTILRLVKSEAKGWPDRP
jgi:HPr Serine kinase C-terminal domain